MLQNIQNAGNAVAGAAKLKAQQEKLQKLLNEIIVTGTSKNGKVVVKVRGDQTILDIIIDPSLVVFVYENFFKLAKDETDPTRSADLNSRGQKFMASSIIEAVQDAISKVQGEVVKKMQESGAMGDLMGMLQAASGQ